MSLGEIIAIIFAVSLLLSLLFWWGCQVLNRWLDALIDEVFGK